MERVIWRNPGANISIPCLSFRELEKGLGYIYSQVSRIRGDDDDDNS